MRVCSEHRRSHHTRREGTQGSSRAQATMGEGLWGPEVLVEVDGGAFVEVLDPWCQALAATQED